MKMEKRLITACVADLTPAREQKLRQAAEQNGFALNIVQKGQYTAQDLAGSEILFGNYPAAMLKEVSSLKWVATASAGVEAGEGAPRASAWRKAAAGPGKISAGQGAGEEALPLHAAQTGGPRRSARLKP